MTTTSTKKFADVIRQYITLGDDGSLDTILECGEVVHRYSQDEREPYCDDDGWFDVDQFIEDHVDDFAESIDERLSETFDEIAKHATEYYEKHTDAGDSYTHLLKEGDLIETRKRLVAYVRENFELSDDFDEAKFWANIEIDAVDMRPGHVFTNGEFTDGVSLDSYPIGEIEEQIELSSIPYFDKEIIVAWIGENNHGHCLKFIGRNKDFVYLYVVSDAVWFCVMSDETISEALDEVDPF